MLQHHQGHSHFRLTTIEDINYLAPRLRYEDKREILASTGLLPYEALLKGYLENVIVFTIVNKKNIFFIIILIFIKNNTNYGIYIIKFNIWLY